MEKVVTPYKSDASKKTQVAEMFNNIAGNYDFLNHFLSCGIDILWRKKAIRLLRSVNPNKVLDIATGTGDFAIEALSLKPESVTGIDISQGMLDVGIEKMKAKGHDHIIELKLADSEDLPFEEGEFDAITAGFGVRNFENLEKGLKEIHRVLSPKGRVAILEFSSPTVFPVKQFYHFYFTYVVPTIGKLFSKDASAYTYLPESVEVFPYGQDFLDIMTKSGFSNVKAIPVTFGIASIYTGEK